jgi:SAM-dependent methyltransferase
MSDTSAVRGARTHWQQVYERKRPEEVSWYEPVPETSLGLIAAAGLDRDAAILDGGGGTSGLARELLAAGWTDVTVADISAAALAAARDRLGEAGSAVDWVEADVCDHDFGRRFDLWHDRATFHFLTDPADRAAYVDVLCASLAPGGFAVIATFGEQGPTHCSGLPVERYGADRLAGALGEQFELVTSRTHLHHTPSGAEQQFLYALLRREPGD